MESLIIFSNGFLANVKSVQKFDLAIANYHALGGYNRHEIKNRTGAKFARGCQSEVQNRQFFRKKIRILKFLKFFFGGYSTSPQDTQKLLQ